MFYGLLVSFDKEAEKFNYLMQLPIMNSYFDIREG